MLFVHVPLAGRQQQYVMPPAVARRQCCALHRRRHGCFEGYPGARHEIRQRGAGEIAVRCTYHDLRHIDAP